MPILSTPHAGDGERKSLVSKLILLILVSASSVACFVYEQNRKRQDLLLDLGLQLTNAVALGSAPALAQVSAAEMAQILERGIPCTLNPATEAP